MKKLIPLLLLLFITSNAWSVTQLKKTVMPSGGDYTSLEACMNANEQDLTAADKYFDVEIDGDWSGGADTSAVTIHNYTTDATRYINIYTTSAARHNGTAAAVSGRNNYRLSSTATDSILINCYSDYTTIDGIEFYGASTWTSSAINMVTDTADYGTIKNNLIHDRSVDGIFGAGTVAAIRLYYARHTKIYNNIIYNITGTNGNAINLATDDADTYIYNNTIYGCTGTGIKVYLTYGVVKNDLSYNNATDFSGGNASSNYNFSKDNTAAGANSIHGTTDGKTPDFVNTGAGAEDFHLQSTSDAIDVGVDLSATFTTDIDGQTRTVP